MPGMGSTMAGGGSGAASGVEGAMNTVPPPAASEGGGSVAVDPPPISAAGDGANSKPESGVVSSSFRTVQTQEKTNRVPDTGEAIGASVGSASQPVGEVSMDGKSTTPAGAPADESSGAGGRSLGEKISGVHHAAAQAHQHLPQDSATVSAPTLHIQHGE